MGRGYDVEGAIIGAASHDAAVIVAAMISRNIVGDPIDSDSVLAAYEWWRSALLASNRAAQAEATSEPGSPQGADYVLPWGKNKGLTLAEIHALPAGETGGDGASYLTWVVANSDDKAAVAQVRSFLAARQT